jgi:hypothetical protein
LNDAGPNGDAALTDALGDDAIESGTIPDATPDTVAKDISADTSPVPDGDARPGSDGAIESGLPLDVTSDTVAKDTSGDTSPVPDGDAEPSDTPGATDSTLADAVDAADVPRDTEDGDLACQCIGPDAAPPAVTTSLACFLKGAEVLGYDYADYAVDPCIGLHGVPSGSRSEQTYVDANLIGVHSSTTPMANYQYFYDATTKALVGATRINWWSGADPLNCPGFPGYRYVTVRAGILPECDGGACSATDSRTLCPVPDSGTAD